MTGIVVRPLEPDEWPTWRDLRLRALADSPDAFRVTLAEAEARTDEEWAARIALSAYAEHEHSLAAFVEGRPAGMGYVGIDGESVGRVFAMWVAPEVRRRGVGSSQLTWMRAFAARHGAGSLALWASLGVPGVLDFYRAFGFVETGARDRLRPGSDVEVVAMALDL